MTIFTGRGIRALLRRLLRNNEMVRRAEGCCRQRWLTMVALAGVAALAGGCAAVGTVSSTVTSLNPSQSSQVFNITQARLQEKNFVVVKANVTGESRGFALLGLITLVPPRFTTAMNRLSEKADLKPGTARTLVNLAVDRDSNFYILFSRPRTTVRADVIEFVPGVQPQSPSTETNLSEAE